MSAESDNTRAPPSTTEILRIEGLRIEARTNEDAPAKLIVEDVDLVLHRGEVLGLIGNQAPANPRSVWRPWATRGRAAPSPAARSCSTESICAA